MLIVIAKANPTTRIDQVDVNVLTELDISFFEGADYKLTVNVTKKLKSLFYMYFFRTHEDTNHEDPSNPLVAHSPAPNPTQNLTPNPASHPAPSSNSSTLSSLLSKFRFRKEANPNPNPNPHTPPPSPNPNPNLKATRAQARVERLDLD